MLECFKIIDNYDKKFQYEILIKCMNGLRYLWQEIPSNNFSSITLPISTDSNMNSFEIKGYSGNMYPCFLHSKMFLIQFNYSKNLSVLRRQLHS